MPPLISPVPVEELEDLSRISDAMLWTLDREVQPSYVVCGWASGVRKMRRIGHLELYPL